MARPRKRAASESDSEWPSDDKPVKIPRSACRKFIKSENSTLFDLRNLREDGAKPTVGEQSTSKKLPPLLHFELVSDIISLRINEHFDDILNTLSMPRSRRGFGEKIASRAIIYFNQVAMLASLSRSCLDLVRKCILPNNEATLDRYRSSLHSPGSTTPSFPTWCSKTLHFQQPPDDDKAAIGGRVIAIILSKIKDVQANLDLVATKHGS